MGTAASANKRTSTVAFGPLPLFRGGGLNAEVRF